MCLFFHRFWLFSSLYVALGETENEFESLMNFDQHKRHSHSKDSEKIIFCEDIGSKSMAVNKHLNVALNSKFIFMSMLL
jgi:hypothetical protein